MMYRFELSQVMYPIAWLVGSGLTATGPGIASSAMFEIPSGWLTNQSLTAAAPFAPSPTEMMLERHDGLTYSERPRSVDLIINPTLLVAEPMCVTVRSRRLPS